MANVKTITATTTESAVEFNATYTFMWFRNLGENDCYICEHSGIVASADDVTLLKAGEVARLTLPQSPMQSKAYIKAADGSNTVEVHAQNYSDCPFKVTGKGGGSGDDGTHYKGTTITVISDGSTANPITIDGESYTAVFGDIVLYNYTEFVFDGTQWSEFGRPFDTVPTSGSANAVTSDGIYQVTPLSRGSGEDSATQKNCSASGKRSIAFGDNTRSLQNYLVSLGRYSTGGKSGDLFNIGNGTDNNNRSNIVEINSTELNVNGDIKKNGVALGALAMKSSATGTAVTNVVYDSANERLVIELGTVTVS